MAGTGTEGNRLINETRGSELGGRVAVVRSCWNRGLGLLLRRGLDGGAGQLIDPCGSIHSMWMGFPIDVLYGGRVHTVVPADAAVPPSRIRPRRTGGRSVVELPAGVIRASTRAGNRLRLEPA